ncbi:hypothetical protein [Phenylobacterium sp.]|uniref:hypothetical protein n=1 Tax=Phenylobacterium sp. TaxID=1871053 RepID=UPI002CCD7E60|nr:hypothetical protein [Phenylobacterium sp.]HVI33618.1 hypothetical protein [Phenylobacterium sp.]
MPRILIAGGYGVVGSWIARELKSAHPDVELLLAGRNPDAGAALAAEVDAKPIRLDVRDPDAAIAAEGSIDLLIASLQDPGDKLAMAAVQRGAAYTSVVRYADTASALAVVAERAGRPALAQGHWQAGVMSLVAIWAANSFARVDSIELGALYDYADPSGPMTKEDATGFFDNGALIRRDGEWLRVDPKAEARMVGRAPDGPSFGARPMTVLDVPGLAGATGARNVRFDLGTGESRGTLAGAAASHEIYIDLRGSLGSGEEHASRTVMSDPKGQAHLTALGIVLGSERLLGLDGRPPPRPGLSYAEAAIDAEAAVARLQEFGVSIETAAAL